MLRYFDRSQKHSRTEPAPDLIQGCAPTPQIRATHHSARRRNRGGIMRTAVPPANLPMFSPLQLWSHLVDWLSSHAVAPVLDLLHLGKLSGDPRDIAASLLIAALQIGIIGFLFRPLETFFPAEKWSDRKLTLVDRNYTVMMLMGIFPLFTYLILMPFSHL